MGYQPVQLLIRDKKNGEKEKGQMKEWSKNRMQRNKNHKTELETERKKKDPLEKKYSTGVLRQA